MASGSLFSLQELRINPILKMIASGKIYFLFIADPSVLKLQIFSVSLFIDLPVVTLNDRFQAILFFLSRGISGKSVPHFVHDRPCRILYRLPLHLCAVRLRWVMPNRLRGCEA